MIHANTPSSHDAEAGGLQILGRPVIHIETPFFPLSQKQNFFFLFEYLLLLCVQEFGLHVRLHHVLVWSPYFIQSPVYEMVPTMFRVDGLWELPHRHSRVCCVTPCTSWFNQDNSQHSPLFLCWSVLFFRERESYYVVHSDFVVHLRFWGL